MDKFFHRDETITLIKCVTVIGILTYGETSILEAVVQLILKLT